MVLAVVLFRRRREEKGLPLPLNWESAAPVASPAPKPIAAVLKPMADIIPQKDPPCSCPCLDHQLAYNLE